MVVEEEEEREGEGGRGGISVTLCTQTQNAHYVFHHCVCVCTVKTVVSHGHLFGVSINCAQLTPHIRVSNALTPL